MANSHIQLTQGLMRGFTSIELDKNHVFYLDLKDNQIKKEKIRILGSKDSYFDEKTEKFLGELETKFGDTCLKLKKMKKVKNTFLSEQDLINIREFVKYTFIRSPKTLEKVNDSSIIAKTIWNISPNFLIDIQRREDQLRFLDNYNLEVLINSTNADFVIPSCVFYEYKKSNDKYERIILPITKKYAVILIHKDEYDKYIENNTLIPLNSKKSTSIKNLNILALNEEKNTNNSFLVGTKSSLQELQKYILQNKSMQ